MTNNILVSIIVPVYKVEKYLAECLDSIVKQTYENIEILIINDGSPDSSGTIADNYSKLDERINVYHRVNQGVSHARNFGLNQAKGEYIVFVDSDDYILSDHVSYLLTLVKNTGAEFCLSTNIAVNTNKESIKTITSEDATCILLYPEIVIGCWNKIYNREFLMNNDILFPTEFFMGEGLNFITKAAQLSNKVGVGNRYSYFYRTDNIDSATKKFEISKINNAFKAIENIEKNLILKTKRIKTAVKFHYYWTNFFALQMLFLSKKNKKHKTEVIDYSLYLKKVAPEMFKAEVTHKTKFKLFLMAISPILTVKILTFLKKK